MMDAMAEVMTRREVLAGLAGAAACSAARPAGVLVESHIHLFASDQNRFPLHPNAPYKPTPLPLETYLKFALEAKIDHAVIVHPEPYQDDHRYLEYCLANEPSPGFFKGTCLFDPVAKETPARITDLAKRNLRRIVALRIHQMREPGTPPLASGAIHDRDMRSPAMLDTWRCIEQLGMAIQMHFLPYYAPQIGELAAKFSGVPVILDHLGRAGQGTPEQFEGILQLAKLPQVRMKYSGVNYSSKEAFPYKDAIPLVRRIWDAFGPDRLIWGVLGGNAREFERQVQLFDQMFAFAAESDRAKIRGQNAMQLYRF
jgi:predicted TIM-barrel fold metal-dependent hydrolase